jgi:hypothetical protein
VTRCRDLHQLLKSTCFNCHRLRITRANRNACIRKISLLLAGRALEACSIDIGGKQSKQGTAGGEDDIEVETVEDAAMGQHAMQFLQHCATAAGLNCTEIGELQVMGLPDNGLAVLICDGYDFARSSKTNIWYNPSEAAMSTRGMC